MKYDQEHEYRKNKGENFGVKTKAKSKALEGKKKESKKEYLTAPSGRKFEITKSHVTGHHHIG